MGGLVPSTAVSRAKVWASDGDHESFELFSNG